MAAAAKSKTTSANGATRKTKTAAPTADGNVTNGGTSPAPAPATPVEAPFEFATYGPGKPDKGTYEKEQEQIKAQIDALQVKVSAVRDRINQATKPGGSNDKRNALRAELDGIRDQQSMSKASRAKVFDQLKAIQDGVQKKVKDLNAAKAKAPFKTAGEVDDRIKQLERQVESGNLKLGDEKRALAEISQLKRSRRIVEGFQAEQESIEVDRARADELRKQLDDPEAKAASERYDVLKAELDELKKEGDELAANRNKLFDERNNLSSELDVLYNRKRESAQRFRDANDKYFTKMNEERARRAERARAQRAAEEEAKKKELAEQIREEAEAPAFQAQIEDCQTLVDYFSGKTSAPSLSEKEDKSVAGVPKLELRKVEAAPAEGMVVRKKKGEDADNYFVAKPRKGQKVQKGTVKPAPAESNNSTSDASSSQSQLHVPLPTLSALLSLSITPPTSTADVPRIVEDLKAKKAWFLGNQARVTAENKQKAEVRIKQLIGKSEKVDVPASDDIIPPNGGGERPAEPASTPAIVDLPSLPVSSEAVVDKLEVVEEEQAADADES
ncbi:hypothetical protein DAEQUDRAFT_761273 [Daedalea quercina L-15889]|uniref:Nuclear segregation protein Bfr1 n=1 Tax=Daedalea quercina L-15889 TaxID=1314783 RepID=A0A165U587_9APHY|nr:hypothetical protein DAEQUDRAFT_761273 [Daedalea quercina L-15889]